MDLATHIKFHKSQISSNLLHAYVNSTLLGLQDCKMQVTTLIAG